MYFRLVLSTRRWTSPVSSLLLSLSCLWPVGRLRGSNVTLAWDPSTDSSVVAYNIYYGGLAKTYTNTVSVGNVTTATVSNLMAGRTYYFAATALNGVGLESDFSAEISYTVPLPNQPPTLDSIANITLNENAGMQTVNLTGITSGATNEAQTLTVTAISSNTSLIPNPAVNYTSPSRTGSLSFTPVPYGFGTATITVTVNDGGTTNNTTSRLFTVTVNPVNQTPTLDALANVTINENAGAQTVNLTGISSGASNEIQTLTVSASSSSPALIPNPTISYSSPSRNGSLSFAPLAYAFGTATITVTVNDGGASNNIVARSFTVTVNPVNQPPTLDPLADITINENSEPKTVTLTGISTGASNEVQALTVTASSSNPTLIASPTVTYSSPATTGSLSLTPSPDQHGVATITVTVNDGGSSNNIVTRSFAVTVNQPPIISSITNYAIAVDTRTPPIPFVISDAETAPENLVLSAIASNPVLVPQAGIVFGGSSTNRTVTVSPGAGQVGTSDITIAVSDGFATNNSTFRLTVEAKPQPPANFRIVGS